MPISVECRSCGGKFQAPEKLAGKRAKCPKCSAVIKIGVEPPQPSEKDAPGHDSVQPIPVACGCGKKFRAKGELAGKRVKCPACGQTLAIPHAGPADNRAPTGSLDDDQLMADETSAAPLPCSPSKAQAVLHSLIALLTLIAVPPVLNEFLTNTLTYTDYVWVRHGELENWASATLDGFFLAKPYWSSYQPGWILGLLPGLLGVSAAWGLWKQRDWGRQLAIAFHGLIAFVAFSVTTWSVHSLWTLTGGVGRDHGGLGGLAAIFHGTIGGIAFGVLLLAAGFLWWLCRAATRTRFETASRQNIGTLFVCCAGVTVMVLAIEFAYNRICVYHGEATYQGQSTGDWLTLLASRSAATRRSALLELGISHESVPVLREMYRGIIARVYRSRAHVAVSLSHAQDVIGRPLALALTDLAKDADSDVRSGAIRLLSE